MSNALSIVWFRQDLRLADNPALGAAAQQGKVLPVYILDEVDAQDSVMGAASRVWLHASLEKLNQSLNHALLILSGKAEHIIPKLIQSTGATAVFWNRCYEPWRIQRDQQLKKNLRSAGVEVHTFNGSLLWEPWTVLKQDGTPYKVFTPYYRKGCLKADSSLNQPRLPQSTPVPLTLATSVDAFREGGGLESLNLVSHQAWEKSILDHWEVGEEAAYQRLGQFLEEALTDYKRGRDVPSRRSTSRLSPHLHFGEISPHQIWHAVKQRFEVDANDNVDSFMSELGWREFSYYQLYHWPDLPGEPFNARYRNFPWAHDAQSLNAWQAGQTGIPIVDAGMRELWQTGYMHNRVRMIVASLLVKNLLIDWREGARWFWDCLFDADLASNSASWQWVAGSGADAAPYFRIFNPVLQGEKFDGDGAYVKRYCPELSQLPARFVHKPWQAPADVLEHAGVVLGDTYPKPIVDLKVSRERALAVHKALADAPG